MAKSSTVKPWFSARPNARPTGASPASGALEAGHILLPSLSTPETFAAGDKGTDSRRSGFPGPGSKQTDLASVGSGTQQGVIDPASALTKLPSVNNQTQATSCPDDLVGDEISGRQ